MKDFIGLYVSGNRSVDSKIPTIILFKRDYLTLMVLFILIDFSLGSSHPSPPTAVSSY